MNFFLFLHYFFALACVDGASLVEWKTPVHYDFGAIQQGRPVAHDFVFVNQSDGPLRVETVRTTCGCTAADWPETDIERGQSGSIRIEYDAYQRGSFKKKIKVFFDKQKKAETLLVTGEVE